MSAPEPPGGHDNGPEIVTGELLALAGRVDSLHDGVAEAQDALRRLASEPLAVGTGQDNVAIAGWYRALLDGDSAPAAAALAADLDAVRLALRRGTAAWEQSEQSRAQGFGSAAVDTPPPDPS